MGCAYGKPMHESTPKKATDSTTEHATAFTFEDAVTAVRTGNVETLNKFQKNYKCRHILQQLDENGDSLGHIAIKLGKPECLAFMLRLVAASQDNEALLRYCSDLKATASRYEESNVEEGVHNTISNALAYPRGRITTTENQDSKPPSSSMSTTEHQDESSSSSMPTTEPQDE